MRIALMTAMALMVATVAVAENEPNWQKDLKFSCPVSGNDNNNVDLLVETPGTHTWECTVKVTTTAEEQPPSKFTVIKRAGTQNLWAKGGLKKDLTCRVDSVTCNLKSSN